MHEKSLLGLPKTESANPLTRDIDTWSALEIVRVMNSEDHRVAPAVAHEIPRIAAASELVARCLCCGRKVLYIGSGTSGRIGVLDASELHPTFGPVGRRFTAVIAGGPGAIVSAVESAEDSRDGGRHAVRNAGVEAGDVVIGIASSGRTPFVAGGLAEAREAGARTIALVGDASGSVAQAAELVIAPDVGPEIITGSTRLKNGTAQKLVLNMISTTAMILLGRTYGNLMAGTGARNNKLSGRARRILATAGGKSEEEVERALHESRGDIAVALVSLLTGASVEESARLLNENKGAIRKAVLVGSTAPRWTAAGTPSKDSAHTGPAGTTAGAPPHEQADTCGSAAAPLNAGIFGSTSPPLPCGRAGGAGLDEVQIERAFQVVMEAVGDGLGQIPGAVAAIVHNGTVVGPRAFGWAMRSPQRIAMTPWTVFDMASLTKVVATTPAVLIACERGLFRLDDPVARFVPGFADGGKDGITLRHLLTHTSGLPAHVRFWEKGLHTEGIPMFISRLQLAPEMKPGAQVVYSDLGFIMLGEVLRRVTGMHIDEFAAQEVFEPLGMGDTGFRPPESSRSRIAATEYRADLGRVMWGEVHDENAFALNGVAGHAGLFSAAEDIARYALMWLGKGAWEGRRILSRASVAAATSLQASGGSAGTQGLTRAGGSQEPGGPRGLLATAGERRGLGWMLKSLVLSSGGDLLSPLSFGHTGFTGTSLWCDPNTGTAAILLTNRVHAGREGNDIFRLRPRFANAVAAAVGR